MRRIYLLLLTGIMFAATANGQSSANYTVSSTTTGSLASDLNANTVDMSTGTTQLVGASNDDLGSSVVTIGFDFWFMGVRYTQFSANSNGSIRLGGTVIGNANYGITSNASNSLISAYGGDLETSSTGKVHYKLVGAAPNRCLVVEFLNIGLDYTGSYANPDGTYQARIYETTGRIEFVYGSMNVNSSTVNSSALTFNIGFSTGTTTANTFLCINNTSTNAFSTTAFTALAPTRPGSGISPIADLNSAANGSRKTYLFTPAIPADPTAISFPTVGAGSMTLNWVDNASNEVGFAVYRSTDGTNYTFINQVAAGAGTGTTIVSAQTGLSPSTNYFWRVYAVTEGGVSNVLSGSQSTSAAVVYTWNGGAGPASWATPGNWTPTRTTPDNTDQIVINTSAVITSVPTQTIGRLTVNTNSTVSLQATATSTLTIASDGTATDELSVASGSSLISDGTAAALTITYSGTGSTGTIAGTMEVTSATGSTTANTFNFTGGTTSVTTVTGTLANGQSGGTGVPVITGSAATLIISSTGIYNHKFTTSGGTIPSATWNSSSTVNITSYTTNSTLTGGLTSQTFGNLTWNCPAQTGNISLGGGTITTGGTFTMTTTNTGSLRLGAGTNGFIIAANFAQTGGSIDCATGGGLGTIRVAGTFNQSGGTITESSTGSGTIEFNGTSAQSVTLAGTISNTISYRVNNNAGINLTGTIAVTTGASLIISSTAAAPISGGAVTYTGTTTLVYNSTAGAQTATANEFLNVSGPTNLTINNTAAAPNNVVSIPLDRTVGGTLTMTAGDINMGANTLTLGTAPATAGTLTLTSGAIVGKFKRWLNNTTGSRDFPVGVASIQRNAAINYTAAPTTGGTLTAEFIATNPGNTGLPLTEGAINVNTAAQTGYWKIDAADGLAGGTYTATFTARNFAGVNSFAGLVLVKRPSGGGNWVLDGTHVTTTGSNTVPVLSRTGITTGFSEFGVGGDNAANPLGQSIVSITTGNWGDASTWSTASVPTSGDAVTIANGHNVTLASGTPPYTAGSLTINSGGTLTANASTLNIGGTLTNNGTVNAGGATINITGASTTGITNAATTGVFNISGGTVNLGITDNTVCNRTFTNNGTLTVSAGTLNVYGNMVSASGSSFNQSGGNINIDGNAGGNAANSVASGTALLQFNQLNSGINLTGGTLTIVDPHANTTASNVIGCSNGTAGTQTSTTAHTTSFGNGVSTDAGGNVAGFRVDPWSNTAYLQLGSVLVAGPTGTNRAVTYVYFMGARGNVTINNGGHLNLSDATYGALFLGGDLTVNAGGTFTNVINLQTQTVLSNTSLALTLTASTNAQTIGGSGTIQNLTASPTANLANLIINNTDPGGVTLSAPLSVSGTLTLVGGFVNTTTTNLLTLGTATSAGTLSGGSSTAYIKGPFARTFPASRTASGTYSATTLYPVGKASYLPIHIDPSTSAGGAAVLRGEAFTTNSGTPGAGVTTLSSNRWEALVTSGGANFTNSFIRLNDAAIGASNKILQSTSAAGSYTGIPAASTFAAGTPNTLTTATSISTAAYSGYFAYGDLTTCAVPADQPTAFVASQIGATAFNGSFTAAASTPSNYLVVRYPNPTTETPPVDFTTYIVGGTLGTGTIVSISSATAFAQTGLTAGTTYNYYIYSYNNSGCSGPVYRTASPLIGSVTTCATAVGVPGTPTVGTITTTSFVVNWTASSTAGVTYELDVATNSTFTSFVTGYNALNVGAVLTYNVNTNINPATTYYVRLRAVDAGPCYSLNSGTLTVTTACNASSIPYTENFNGATTPNLPACTSIENLNADGATWTTIAAPTGFTGNTLRYNYSIPNAANDWFYTNGINLVGGTQYRLTFKYGNNSTTYVESMKVYYGSSAAFGSMTNFLADFPTIDDNTVHTFAFDFVPVSSGVYYLGFQAYSEADQFDLYLDDINLDLTPPCPAPTSVSSFAATSTTASVTFTSGGSNFIVEYGATGFTPGLGATAGAGGTVVTGTASPIALTGLTGSTNYDVYVRQVCAGPIYSFNSTVATFSTPCPSVPVPYLEDFESLTEPAPPVCIRTEDLNGGLNPDFFYPATWIGFNDAGAASSGTKSMVYMYSTTVKGDDWFFTKGLNLTGGTSYTLKFKYKASDGPTYVESMEVKYGNGRSAASMTLGTLFTNSTINSSLASPFAEGSIEFIPASTGEYYIGFHCNSVANQAYLVVDDVSVDVTPPCAPPSAVSVGSITTTTASVSFTSAGTSFIVEYGATGFTPGTGGTAGAGGTIVTGGSSPIGLSSLTNATTYDVYVRQVCAGPFYGANTSVITFNTLCSPVTTFTEDWDGVVAPAFPVCFFKVPNSLGSAQPQASNANSPLNTLYIYSPTTSSQAVVALRPVSNAGANTHQLRFRARGNISSGETLQVGYMSDPLDASTFTLLQEFIIPSLTYNQFICDPGTAPGSNQVLAFRNKGLSGFSILIDDINWEAIPACAPPTSVTVGSITATTASVSFVSGGSNFIVEYGAPGFTPGTDGTPGAGGTIVTGTASPIGLTGLTAATTYDVYMRQVCAGPTYGSNTSIAVTFTTLCNAVSIPYTENFDAVTAPAVPACITVTNNNADPYQWITSTTNAASAPNSMYMRWNSSLPMNDWFFTPGLNLTGGTLYRLTFKYNTGGGGFIESLRVRLGTGPSAGGMTTTLVDLPSITNTTYQTVTYDFDPGSTGVFYIGFQGYSITDQYYIVVDDVSVDLAPACASPTGVTVLATGSNSASVSFTSPGTNFIVEYGAPGFTPGTLGTAGAGGTIVTGTSSPIALTGLTGGPSYDIYVRRVCAGPTYSLNTSVTAFLQNDDAPGARTLTLGAGCTGTETIEGATKSTGEVYPSCSGVAATPIWYKFVAPASGAVRISTDGGTISPFDDSKLAIFSAENVNDYTSFNIISCDDDGGSLLGLGYRSVLYATGLTSGTTYYVAVDKFDAGTLSGTFCITVDELNNSMIATTSDCSISTQTPQANGVTNYTGWVALVDEDSKLVALVRNAAGGAPDGYTFRQNINTSGIRTDVTSGEKYLDRNFRINNSTATNVDVQFFFLTSELTALTAADPAATLANLRVTKQTGTTCQDNFATANGTNSELAQAGSATSADGLVKWIQVNTPDFSNFYIHSTRAPLIVKTFLQGAYNSGAGRHKDVTPGWAAILNANALNQPYNNANFLNYNGGESVTAGFFTSDATHNRDVVDWVLLEVKNASLVTVARRAAFVREDGKIIDINGDTLVTFNGLGTGTFYLTVRHRNHLGMSVQNLLPVTAKGLGVPPPTSTYDFDFTTATDPNIFGDALAYKVVGGANVMICGNANSNGNVRYINSQNDPGSILLFLGSNPIAILSNVYTPNDVNMDGTVRYINSQNDPGFLLANALGGSPVLIVNEQKR